MLRLTRPPAPGRVPLTPPADAGKETQPARPPAPPSPRAWHAGACIGVCAGVFVLWAVAHAAGLGGLLPEGWRGRAFGIADGVLGAVYVLLLAAVVLLDRRARAAETAEAKLKAVLGSVPACCILIVNGRGRIVSANAQTAQVFGYRAEELAGRAVEF